MAGFKASLGAVVSIDRIRAPISEHDPLQPFKSNQQALYPIGHLNLPAALRGFLNPSWGTQGNKNKQVGILGQDRGVSGSK
jgi:hypothetical protein